MDGPSTNWAFLDLLTSDREAEELPKLVNIGSCGLHIIHGAFKTGFESVDWAVKNTLKGCYNLFHDSPARRDDYVSVSGSDIFPLSFCATRWVEDQIVADRLLSIWDNVVKVIRFWEKKPKSKQPKCKLYINVQKACNDIFTVARLNFFSYVAGFFKPFLKSYQSNSPMIPYLYTDLSELVKKILQFFIRADVVNANLKDFRRIEMKNENFLKISSICLGFACESSLAKIKNKDEATDSEIKKFKKQCQEVLLTTIGKLFERCPLGSVVVRSATCFDPIKILSETTERNEKKLKILLHHLLRLNILSTVVCDTSESQYSDLLKEFVPKNQNLFEGFNRASTRLDHFYFNSEKIRLKIPNELGK